MKQRQLQEINALQMINDRAANYLRGETRAGFNARKVDARVLETLPHIIVLFDIQEL